MAFALVTPSSRGIGLALTRHLLRTTPDNVPVIATCRSDVEGVREAILSHPSLPSSSSSRLDLVRCDLTSEPSISSLATHIRSHYIDPNPRHAHLRLALCIPGMLVPERSPAQIDHDAALHTLRLNLLAPMMLAKHLSPFLLPQKKKDRRSAEEHENHQPEDGDDGIGGLNPSASILAFMSARVGSIADNRLGGWYSYRASKAGVNQLVRTVDRYLELQAGLKSSPQKQQQQTNQAGKTGGDGKKQQQQQQAMCIALHPGTVKTDLSREFWGSTPKEKLFEPEVAAERLMDVVRGLEVRRGRGRCWDWKGEEIQP